MDFANEYYVRLYTRDTTTWKRLLFNGQAVLTLVLRKMDMAGVIDLEDMEPWEAAVLHAGIPEDIARDGMARCLERGVFVHRGHFLVAPKYREANEACKTDRQRQLESRARRRTKALEQIVTDGDQGSHAVTRGHVQESQNGTTPSRSVTKHHERSHAVTLTNSGSGSDAVAASERTVTPVPNGNGSRADSSPPAAAPNGSERVSGRDAAATWHRVMCMPKAGIAGTAHAFKHWGEDFELIAAACNATCAQGGRPRLALQVATEWFWLAPDGPIQAGRIARSAANPEQFAKRIGQDLESALAWWTSRKQQQPTSPQQPEPHEAAE